MVNEIINTVNRTHNKVSFSLSFGGDRFPLFEPVDALMAAQKDEKTKAIVYYGELGGEDEYKLAKLLEIGHITKPVICYVAGTISDLFETPPQFGHAKAMAGTAAEGAKEKREALKKAGAQVPESFSEFVKMIQDLSDFGFKESNGTIENMDDRKHALIMMKKMILTT
jgi:succinyl-CoA synthetase alpha subunit